MTKEQMRVVIAECCGWKFKNVIRPNNWAIYSPNGNAQGAVESEIELTLERFLYYIPNYPEDLNACHEMEKVLTHDQWRIYLGFIMGARIIPKLASMEEFHHAWSATPLERCEAFIKTVCPERWVD